jgi:hypothetical protein
MRMCGILDFAKQPNFFVWKLYHIQDTWGVFESPLLTTLELTRHDENGGLERQEPTRERVRGPRFLLSTCWRVRRVEVLELLECCQERGFENAPVVCRLMVVWRTKSD